MGVKNPFSGTEDFWTDLRVDGAPDLVPTIRNYANRSDWLNDHLYDFINNKNGRIRIEDNIEYAKYTTEVIDGKEVPVITFPRSYFVPTPGADGEEDRLPSADYITSTLAHELQHYETYWGKSSSSSGDRATDAATWIVDEARGDAAAWAVQREINATDGQKMTEQPSVGDRQSLIEAGADPDSNPSSGISTKDFIEAGTKALLPEQGDRFVEYYNSELPPGEPPLVVDGKVTIYDTDKDGVVDAVRYKSEGATGDTLLMRDSEGTFFNYDDAVDDLLDGVGSPASEKATHLEDSALAGEWSASGNGRGFRSKFAVSASGYRAGVVRSDSCN